MLINGNIVVTNLGPTDKKFCLEKAKEYPSFIGISGPQIKEGDSYVTIGNYYRCEKIKGNN